MTEIISLFYIFFQIVHIYDAEGVPTAITWSIYKSLQTVVHSVFQQKSELTFHGSGESRSEHSQATMI